MCVGEGYLDKSMYLHFVGEVLIISNPQESATDLAKVNKGSRAITSQTWKGLIYCLHFFKNNKKRDDLANHSLINLTSKFGEILKKEKKNYEMSLQNLKEGIYCKRRSNT